MRRLVFLFLMIFFTGNLFASLDFMEVLETFNGEGVSCTTTNGSCVSSIRSVRCSFESVDGQAIAEGNCSYSSNNGQLKVIYDQEAFDLFFEASERGVHGHYNGREFKLELKRVSCHKKALEAATHESTYTCQITI